MEKKDSVQEFKETRLIIVLMSAIVVLAFFIGFVLGGSKKNIELITKEDSNNEVIEDEESENLKYDLNCVEDGIEKRITIEVDGKAIYVESAGNTFTTRISNIGMKTLNNYFESFVGDNSTTLITKKDGVYTMDINADNSESYTNYKNGLGVIEDSEFKTIKIFSDVHDILKSIMDGEENHRSLIIGALQQY